MRHGTALPQDLDLTTRPSHRAQTSVLLLSRGAQNITDYTSLCGAAVGVAILSMLQCTNAATVVSQTLVLTIHT